MDNEKNANLFFNLVKNVSSFNKIIDRKALKDKSISKYKIKSKNKKRSRSRSNENKNKNKGKIESDKYEKERLKNIKNRLMDKIEKIKDDFNNEKYFYIFNSY